MRALLKLKFKGRVEVGMIVGSIGKEHRMGKKLIIGRILTMRLA